MSQQNFHLSFLVYNFESKMEYCHAVMIRISSIFVSNVALAFHSLPCGRHFTDSVVCFNTLHEEKFPFNLYFRIGIFSWYSVGTFALKVSN